MNALGPDGGTNWEDGLAKANGQSSNRAGAKKYIVFLSDGLPTFRNTGNWRDGDWNGWYGAWGNGNTDPDGKNAAAAVTEANKRGTATTLYSVYASAERDVVKGMTDFANKTNATVLNGTDLEALQKSFAVVSIQLMLLFIADGMISSGIGSVFQYNSCYSLSVIGNIFDNPELGFNTTHVTLYL